MRFIKLLSITASLLFFIGSPIAAEEVGNYPIHITSDKMEAETKENRLTFEGHVVARQKDMTITSKRLTATYDESGKELKEVLAVGDVRVTQKDKMATADEAIFVNNERKIILTGNPKVWQGRDVISGDRIIYYLDEERSVVEGGSSRVKVVIHPGKEGTFANTTGKGPN